MNSEKLKSLVIDKYDRMFRNFPKLRGASN